MSETEIPDNLLYSENHEWIHEDSNVTTLGITNFAQTELGDIVFVELPEVAEHIVKGEAFGTVEAVKTVADLIAPASGEVLEVNQGLEEDAERINNDPYGAGWMLRVRIDDRGDLEQLLNAREYAELLANQ